MTDIDLLVRECQRKLALNPLDPGAIRALFSIIRRTRPDIIRNYVKYFRKRAGTAFHDSMLCAVLLPMEIQSEDYAREHTFIILSGDNYSGSYPFFDCRLYLTKDEKYVRGVIQSAESLSWTFGRGGNEKFYEDLLAYIVKEAFSYHHDPDSYIAPLTLESMDVVFRNQLEEKFQIYNLRLNNG